MDLEDKTKTFIETEDNHIIITHNIYNECKHLNYKNIDEYLEITIENYRAAEELNYCEILEINNVDFIITTRMPKYETLINNLSRYINNSDLFIEKLSNLFNDMYVNNFIHWNFTPSNIGINSNGDFVLFDLADLHLYYYNDEFNENFIECYLEDSIFTSFGFHIDDYNQALQPILNCIPNVNILIEKYKKNIYAFKSLKI